MSAPVLECRDFHSYEELARERTVLNRLVRAYQGTFGESEVWGESYSDTDVREKLRDELAGLASLRVCVDPADESVAAFFWAQLCGADDVLRAIGTIKYAESLATPELLSELREAIGDRKVIYIHDFGVVREHRGRVRLTRLIGPPLWEIGARTGNGRVLFWSVPGTQVSVFARRAGFEEVLVTHGMHFHLGEFLVARPCDGINLPWSNRERGRAAVV